MTSDVGYRRGNRGYLKGISDEEVQGLDFLEHIVVWRRKENKPSLGPEDVDFHELLTQISIYCSVEVVDSEDPLCILYTSGTARKPKGMIPVHGGYMVGTHCHFKSFWDVKDDDVFWCTSDIGWVVGHSYIYFKRVEFH